MIRFPKIQYWMIIAVVVIFAADLTVLFAQTSDTSMSKEANSPNNTSKVEFQSEDSASPNTMENADRVTKIGLQGTGTKTIPTEFGGDSVTDVETQRLLNKLRKELLDDRADYIDMWLAVIAIVLTFFGIVIAVLGVVGYRKFRELEAEARRSVEEIKGHHARAEAYTSGMTSEDMGDLDKVTEVEEIIQDAQSNPEPSFVDKVKAEIYTLQRDGKIEEVIEKWRSIANIAEGNDNELAASAWLSIRYFLTEEEDRHAAYNKAMDLDPSYTRAYISRRETKYSNLSRHGTVVGAVQHYFDDPRFERFSTALVVFQC